MSLDPNRETPRVREGRPTWPRRGPDDEMPIPRRWLREPEVWETPFGAEEYPGATVLEDLDETLDEPLRTLRILARYAVIRVLLLSTMGLLRGAKLRQERRIATEHLALLPGPDWERMALQRLTDLCRDTPPPQLLGAAATAAEAAAKRGHAMGAFALFSAVYQIGLDTAAWADAARGASGISRLAQMDEARYSTRLWERRANVLERRAARAAAEAAEAAAAAAAAEPAPGDGSAAEEAARESE